jgi:hypothetical protein
MPLEDLKKGARICRVLLEFEASYPSGHVEATEGVASSCLFSGSSTVRIICTLWGDDPLHVSVKVSIKRKRQSKTTSIIKQFNVCSGVLALLQKLYKSSMFF